MSNVKLWSILLPILLTIVEYNRICNTNVLGQLISDGNIGCLLENVCLESEICMNDLLFGKCIKSEKQLELSKGSNPLDALEVLEYIVLKFGPNIEWRNSQVQCVLKNILMHHEITSDAELDETNSLCKYKDSEERLAADKPFNEDAPRYYAENHEKERTRKREDEESQWHLPVKDLPVYWKPSPDSGYNVNTTQQRSPRRFFKKGLESESPQSTSQYERTIDASPDLLNKRRYRLLLPMDSDPPKTPTKSWVWVRFYGRSLDTYEAQYYLKELSMRLSLASPMTYFFLDRTGKILYFHVPTNTGTTAEAVGTAIRHGFGNFDEYHVADTGFGRGAQTYLADELKRPVKSYTTTLVLCLSIAAFFVLLLLMYLIHFCRMKLKMHATAGDQLVDIEKLNKNQSLNDKRKSMTSRLKSFLKHAVVNKKLYSRDCLVNKSEDVTQCSSDSSLLPAEKEKFGETKVSPYRRSNDTITPQSSTSSWSSEPVSSGIDVTMGHLILSYMEDYIKNKNKLVLEWDIANSYESEEATPCADAVRPDNVSKNRPAAPTPYDQSRVRLRNAKSDYINASLLYDHNPRNPGYIATPTPMANTIVDFWAMIWEQSCVVLVCLERTSELKQVSIERVELFGDSSVQYWPSEGKAVCGQFEIHLVSEHSWCENYKVRSFYLKNLQTDETRTLTQFHYLTWTDENLLTETKQLLEFRRKVNRSFRGMMSPIVVHCLDGCGRTGTYVLLDLVLNRVIKGLKEINIAASLEHLRDQRQKMVQSKDQYEFVFTAVAREVDAMLKANHQTAQ